MTESPVRVEAGQPDAAASGNVPQMTTDAQYPDLPSLLSLSSWKWKRLTSCSFVFVGIAGTLLLTWAGEFRGALYWASIGAVWIAIASYESGWASGFRDAQDKAAERAISEAKAEATRAAELALAAETPKPISVESRSNQDGEGFVYVIRFSTDAIKVGQTVEPQVRLNKHRRDAEAYKVHIADYWISPQHANYLTNETLLIERCQQIGVGVKKEYFHGMDFAETVQIAGRLPYLTLVAEVTR